MSVTDEIKARLDIVAYIQQSVPLKKAGRSYKACCPFHNERTPSFVVNPDRQTWRCFGACSEGGDIFSFAMKQHGWTFVEALNELGKLAGVEVKPRSPQQKEQDAYRERLRGLVEEAAQFYHEWLFADDANAVNALRYAREQRGFTDETIRQYAIGYAPPGWQNALDHLKLLGYDEADILAAGIATKNEEGGRVYDRFRNRLMIPIRDGRGRIIGFGARVLDPDDIPKYLNSPQTPLFDKSRTLFGLDVARKAIRDSETAVIVEGYMDAIQAHQAGFMNVVAQMGTALTEPQLRQIARSAKKIVLALDSDAAGQSATRRSLEVAQQTLQADFAGRLSVDIRILQIPDAKDPDDLIRESSQLWQELVDGATPVADYVIDMEMTTLSENATVQERETVARRLLPILLASENNLYQKDNIQKLAMRLRIAERDLLALADEQQRIDRARPPRQSIASSDTFEPPEMPPLDYDAMDAPPFDDEFDDVALPNVPSHRPMLVPQSRDGALESDCLRMLFQYPDLFYQANRKFRELAGNDSDLTTGPLNALCADDFSSDDYRALMMVFLAAVEQDDYDLPEFLEENLDRDLLMLLDTVMHDAIDGLRPHLRHGLAADHAALMKDYERLTASLDVETEFVGQVLRLRSRRLQREREELVFLQVESNANQDDDGARVCSWQLSRSMRAKRLIDIELQRLSHSFRD
ncbi:MAG: DNA primase [Phototrophicales bacterium]|nr:MAG: DNA primase [Phototrophicales bacterium]